MSQVWVSVVAQLVVEEVAEAVAEDLELADDLAAEAEVVVGAAEAGADVDVGAAADVDVVAGARRRCRLGSLLGRWRAGAAGGSKEGDSEEGRGRLPSPAPPLIPGVGQLRHSLVPAL